MRCFFHVSYDKMAWDSQGAELRDIAEVRSAAVRLSGALLSDIEEGRLWRGTPWRLWVTDGPRGTGNTVLALRFVADDGAWDADLRGHETHAN